MCSSSDRKFFGKPNGTNPPAKQSKLSFSTKSAAEKDPPSSGSSKENEDVEMKDEESEADVKPKVERKDEVDTKENVKTEKGMRCTT